MKLLTLMRHAKSSWKDMSLDDFDRPLNKRGKRNAPEMGDRLAARGVRPDRIVASPARRAWRTAGIVGERLGVEDLLADVRLYGATTEEVVEIVQDLDDALGHVMLFGHNPTFTSLVDVLTGVDLGNVPTAGVVEISFPVDSWRHVGPGFGDLIEFDYPKKNA